MASTQTASRLWKSHPTESTVSQAGRQATLFLTPLSPFPLCCIYLSVCLYLLSPPAWCLGVIHLKYLSCPSKNDLRGRGKSIFSQSGHGQAILGTRGISHYCTLPRSLSLQPTVLWRIAQFVTSWLCLVKKEEAHTKRHLEGLLFGWAADKHKCRNQLYR